jgi:lysophospholipase L1-like esterase
MHGDILRHRPTVATIMLGMNDVRRNLYDEGQSSPDLPQQREAALQAHFEAMHKLAERLNSEQVALIFMTPSPYDHTAKLDRLNSPGVNDALALCGENARKLAAQFHGQLVEFNEPMRAINQALQTNDPTASIIGADRIHPGEKGHLVMAYLFLKAQNAPQFVADITFDALGRREVEFSKLEKALPFPVPAAAEPALQSVPFMEELNQERLKVTRLPDGNYDLLIDGTKTASFQASDLSNGVNLATLPETPQMKQAQEVAKLDAKRHAISKRLRTIDYVEWKMGREIGDPTPFDWGAELERLNADPKMTGWPRDRLADYAKLKPQQPALLMELEETIAAIRKASQPREHHFAVRPAGLK